MSIRGFTVDGDIQRYDYNYLDNVPAPIAVDSDLSNSSENPVQNKVIKSALDEKGTYSKPSTGIPKTDLASNVQESLEKADTAIQEDELLKTYPLEDANGEIVSFIDGADDVPVKDLIVGIEPVQDLHGYDNPWPGGGGKNKLKPRTLDELKAINTSGTWSRNTYTFNGISYAWNIFNGYADTVAISGTATGFSRCNIYMNADLTEYSGMVINCDVAYTSGFGLTIQGANSPWTTYGSSSGTDRTISTIDPVPCNIFFGVQANTVFNSPLLIQPMIRPASEADSNFIHYSNICPISGWTGANVMRTGKNLVPKFSNGTNNGVTATVNDDGSVALSGTATGNVTFSVNLDNVTVNSLRGNTVTFSGIATATIFVQMRVGVNGSYTYPTTQTGAKTIQIPVDCDSLRVDVRVANGAATGVSVYPQLELGSTATAYEPYSGDTYNITFPAAAGTVYGGTLDVTVGKLAVDKTIVTLDGTSKKFVYKYPDREVYQHALAAQAKDVSPGKLSKTLCDKLPTKTDNQVQAGSANGISVRTTSTGSAIKACLVSENLGSLASANEWLTSNPLQVCYELATPIVYDLAPTEVKTLLGTNNIWADTGDVAVEYRADTKLYIDKKIASISGGGGAGYVELTYTGDSFNLRTDEDGGGGDDAATIAAINAI